MPQSLPAPLVTWLRRVQRHPLRSRLLLSGSALIAATYPHARTPNDLDYVVTGEFDTREMQRLVDEVIATRDPGRYLRLAQYDEIFEYTDDFPGARIWLREFDDTRVVRQFTVDFAFGDPLTVPPREVMIADVGPVLAVGLESLFAWKVHAIVQFGLREWRAKDVYDLYILWTEGRLDAGVLPGAIDVAFSSRGNTLDELDDFRSNPAWGLHDGGVEQWRVFARIYGVERSFESIRADVRAALDQLLR